MELRDEFLCGLKKTINKGPRNWAELWPKIWLGGGATWSTLKIQTKKTKEKKKGGGRSGHA